jgi:hypothetical protein
VTQQDCLKRRVTSDAAWGGVLSAVVTSGVAILLVESLFLRKCDQECGNIWILAGVFRSERSQLLSDAALDWEVGLKKRFDPRGCPAGGEPGSSVPLNIRLVDEG